MSASRHRVVIAGGGIAATELLLALHTFAEDRVDIELLAPGRDLVYKPLAVAEPFGVGQTLHFDLDAILAEHGATRHAGTLAGVDSEASVAVTGGGAELRFDSLAITVGAVAREAVPGALTLSGGGFGEYGALLQRLGGSGPEQVVFVVPAGSTWSLPLYEIVLMTAAWLEKNGRSDVGLTIVTPEDEPLGVFGRRASDAVRELLAERGIGLHTSTYTDAIDDGHLVVRPGKPVPADRVVALPTLQGPRISGLPCDSDGFIPVDAYGHVNGTESVWAAGDATTFPVKQGGLATQQADAVAESIAARAGVAIEPRGFDPILRGLLLTGSVPAFLRTELRPGRGDTSQAESEPIWWPPSKIAGVHLSHYLARLAAATPPGEPFGLRIETDDLEPHLQTQPGA
jgi:sulfide:quinone oxidoreductase